MHDVVSHDSVARQKIMSAENWLKTQPNIVIGDSDALPLQHLFTDGIYCRIITVPAGTRVVTKIHKREHPDVLLSGTVLIYTEDGGHEEITGPKVFVCKSGTKRVVYAVTKLEWMNIHHNPNNTQDLVKIEEREIAESYEDYDRFISHKPSKIKLFFQPLIKLMPWLG